MSRRARARASVAAAALLASACAAPRAAPGAAPGASTPPAGARGLPDTLGLVPPGFGSLRQDEITVHLRRFGLQISVMPLDESIIRLLAPDAYRSVRDVRLSRQPALAAVERRAGGRGLSVWLVTFVGTEQGETRFSPMELVVSNVGRDFRPADVLPVTPGFGEQRVAQRQTQRAIYAFDGELDVNQPLTVRYEGEQSVEWQDVLPRVERERTLVRSRARRP